MEDRNPPQEPSASVDPAGYAVERVVVQRGAGWEGPGGAWEQRSDFVAVEAPLTLAVEGTVLAVLMRTPGSDRELAAGFLLSEGVIGSAADVFEISLCPSLRSGNSASVLCANGGEDGAEGGDRVDILLADRNRWESHAAGRRIVTSSACGVCSRTSLLPPPVPDGGRTSTDGVRYSAERLVLLPDRLKKAQPGFAQTGGLHACGWWRSVEKTLPDLVYEDVGRHNALDKLLGDALLNRIPLEDGVLVLSGRISYEMVQKAHAGKMRVVVAVGAPSSLALEYAELAGITVCGFTGRGRINVYTHLHRIC